MQVVKGKAYSKLRAVRSAILQVGTCVLNIRCPYLIGMWKCCSFVEGGKRRESREKPSEQGENQQQTQPT